MRFGFWGLVDLKWPSGISIYRHDAKIQKSKNHKKSIMKLFFKDPWERSGGWNDAQWSTLTGHGLEVGGRGCQKEKKSRKDYRFYKLQWLVKTGSQKKILRHWGVQSRQKWHAGAFGTTPGVQNHRKWPKIPIFPDFPDFGGRKCLKQTAGRHIPTSNSDWENLLNLAGVR